MSDYHPVELMQFQGFHFIYASDAYVNRIICQMSTKKKLFKNKETKYLIRFSNVQIQLKRTLLSI